MAASPTFSIITPAFNGGPYLERTVRSALAQSHGDFELILVDDGSTDGSLERVARLGDPRLRIVRTANEGAPAACNVALEMSRGAYVALLDHDDLWSRGKLSSHLRCFEEHPETDLSFTWSSFIGPDDEEIGLPRPRRRGVITFEELLVDNVIGCSSSVAIRRRAIEAVGPFDRRLPLMYDLDLYLRILHARPASARAIPQVLAFYRRHPGQMSGNWRALRADWRALLDKARKLAPEPVARLEAQADANMIRYFAFVAYEGREFRAACDLLLEGLSRAPRAFAADPRNWKLTAACAAARLLPQPIHRRLEMLAGIGAAAR